MHSKATGSVRAVALALVLAGGIILLVSVLGAVLGGCGGAHKPAPATPAATEPASSEPATAASEESSDGLEVSGLHGTLDPGLIQGVVQERGDAVQSCFAAGTRGAGYVGGRLLLKFRVARSGQVVTVHVAESDVGSWPVEKCVLGVFRKATFPKPDGGEVEFSLPLELPARRGFESVSEDAAQTILGPHLRSLAACDSRNPREGDVLLTLYVGPRGAVGAVGFASPTWVKADGWAECAAAIAAQWKLSDPRGHIQKVQAWVR